MPSTSAISSHQDKLLWAKVTAAKAHAETTNIAKRMGKMEELEKGMALLEKMRGIIGQERYASQVCSIFAAMPNFQSFDSAVDIGHNVGLPAADVDRTPSDAVEWTTAKRRLSSDDDEEEEEECTPPSKKKKRTGAAKTPDDDDEGGDDDEGSNDDEGFDDDDEACADGLSRYVLTEADEAKYVVTYTEVTDEGGQVIAIHAVDSRVPTDAADGTIIPFRELKDKDGNVVDRVYGHYKKKK